MLNLTAAALLAVAPNPVAQVPAAPAATDAGAPGTDGATPTQAGPVSPPPVESKAPEPQRGDILVTGHRRDPGDPLRAVNAKSFAATQAVDSAVIGPVSMAYARTLPRPVRSGIHNFLYNLREPVVFVNFLVQLKPGKAAETVGRFAINSTVGAAGLFDVARKKPFHLPRRANGFADTLGYYGVHNGPFLFLPITGPTTVRDLIGGTLDRLLLPLGVGKPFTKTYFTAPLGVLGALDHRADFDPTLHKLHDGVADPYASTRAFYLARRQAEIDHLHGRGPLTGPVGEAPVDSGPIPFPARAGEPAPKR